MFIGAAFWGSSGSDLWQALANQQMESYLNQLGPVKSLLVANTIFWTIGALFLGIAVSMMSGFCISKTSLAQIALTCALTAVPMAIVAFIIMLSIAINSPSEDIATIIGWIGARLDDIATMLIVGASPFFLSLAGRRDWVPGWLVLWGYLAGITGLLSVISILTGIVALGFIIIPIGLGWMIAAGIVLLRKR